jgi:chloramphenicol 3-O-phosphotransferase
VLYYLGMIFLISGMPAVGKSSVAHALLQRFERGVHLPVDDLRAMVVSGMVHPVPTWTDAAAAQFALARASAVQMALRYSAAGYAVAIDDVLLSYDFDADYAPHFQGQQPQRVLLLPRLEVALQRNASRTNKDFHPDTLVGVITHLHAQYSSMDASGWHVLDSSDMTVEKTVDAILAYSNSGSPKI